MLHHSPWCMFSLSAVSNKNLPCLTTGVFLFLLINNRNVFLTILEAGSLRSGCRHGQVQVRALFQGRRQMTSPSILTWWKVELQVRSWWSTVRYFNLKRQKPLHEDAYNPLMQVLEWTWKAINDWPSSSSNSSMLCANSPSCYFALCLIPWEAKQHQWFCLYVTYKLRFGQSRNGY